MLSTKTVIKRVELLEKELCEIEEALEKLKERCPHNNLRYKEDGISGNWDKYEAYWILWYCPDCKKRWMTNTPSNEEEEARNKYPHAKRICRYTQPKKYKNFYNYELVKNEE